MANDDEVRFGYAVDKRLVAFWLPFGLRPATDGVTLTPDAKFVATFGFFKIETPLEQHRRRAHHPELPMVDRRGRTRVVRR